MIFIIVMPLNCDLCVSGADDVIWFKSHVKFDIIRRCSSSVLDLQAAAQSPGQNVGRTYEIQLLPRELC